MSVDLIYRMQRPPTYAVDSSGFFLAKSRLDALRMYPLMARDRGAIPAVKLALKVLLKRCYYFGIADENKPLTSGVLALGYCRFYSVSADSIVIGEIETDPRHRGEGHATRSIKLAINAMVSLGAETFYIDTQQHNVPMIRSIAKLGFGSAVNGTASGSHS